METLTCERGRVQCLLYPWILFSLMQEDSFPGSLMGTPLPEVGRSITCSVAGCDIAVIRQTGGAGVRLLDLRSQSLPADSIGFAFRSQSEALGFFENNRFPLRSLRGLSHVPAWFRFIRNLLALKQRMSTQAWQHAQPQELLAKTLLTLRAAVAGLNGLREVDDFSRGLMDHLPDGRISLFIGGVEANLGCITVQEGRLSWVSDGSAVGGRSVDFRFANLEVAWKSVANLADNLAAVGKGEIQLRGYIPLADGFNHLLDRLQMYVSTS
ncbi:MAG: hypothetical protein ABQ298_12030 [Puniceicoccaceae bacterium]